MSRALFGHVERVDRVLDGTVLLLAGASAMMLANPGLRIRILAPALDLALDSVAVVITGSIALLAWVRFRERGEPFAMFQSAAFLALAIANARAVIETIGPDLHSPPLATEPGETQLYVFTAARMLTGAFLVIGGVAALHGRHPRHPRAVLGVSVLLMIAVIALVSAGEGRLAHMVAPATPALAPSPTAIPSVTPIGVAVEILGAILFGAAAIVCRELWRRDRRIGDAYVTFGLVLAAFAALHDGISASTHPGPVTSGDLLRLGFYATLILAIEAEARSILTTLRRANETLGQLRESEVARAAMVERAFLSRELHDGLAQDLWLAKLKVGRLSSLDLDPEARTLADEIGGAIEVGLAEARQAVMALRVSAESEDQFGELLTKYVQDFEERFGLRVELECDADLPRLPGRTQAELLRIAQEALTNVRRHADATTVRIQVGCAEGRFSLSIGDNGRGFDPSSSSPDSFGLTAMRERAALIGGELSVISAPGDGTRIRVTAPLVVAAGTLR